MPCLRPSKHLPNQPPHCRPVLSSSAATNTSRTASVLRIFRIRGKTASCTRKPAQDTIVPQVHCCKVMHPEDCIGQYNTAAPVAQVSSFAAVGNSITCLQRVSLSNTSTSQRSLNHQAHTYCTYPFSSPSPPSQAPATSLSTSPPQPSSPRRCPSNQVQHIEDTS